MFTGDIHGRVVVVTTDSLLIDVYSIIVEGKKVNLGNRALVQFPKSFMSTLPLINDPVNIRGLIETKDPQLVTIRTGFNSNEFIRFNGKVFFIQ